jgi:hypothetical protein
MKIGELPPSQTAATLADIAVDANLSAAAQAVVTAGACDQDSNLSVAAQNVITAGPCDQDGNLSAAAQAVVTAGPCDQNGNLSLAMQEAAAGRFNALFVDCDSSRAILTSELKGQTIRVTGNYTPTIPAATVGLHAVFEATTAAIFSIDPSVGTDTIELDGTVLAAGNKIASNGAKRASVYVKCEVNGAWIVRTIVPTFADGGA